MPYITYYIVTFMIGFIPLFWFFTEAVRDIRQQKLKIALEKAAENRAPKYKVGQFLIFKAKADAQSVKFKILTVGRAAKCYSLASVDGQATVSPQLQSHRSLVNNIYYWHYFETDDNPFWTLAPESALGGEFQDE